MTLRVPYSDFAATATRFEAKEAYILTKRGATAVTSVMKSSGRILFARTDDSLEAVREELTKQGLLVFDGAWSIDPPDEEVAGATEKYIAAVSYVSSETMPGIWIDAYPWQPTQVQVLRALYDEFRSTGECPEIPFEEFIRLSVPNVAIVGPLEIDGFLESKGDC